MKQVELLKKIFNGNSADFTQIGHTVIINSDTEFLFKVTACASNLIGDIEGIALEIKNRYGTADRTEFRWADYDKIGRNMVWGERINGEYGWKNTGTKTPNSDRTVDNIVLSVMNDILAYVGKWEFTCDSTDSEN